MSVQFESLNKVTLTEQVMQQLAAKIISGELKPGEKLPPERELSQMLEVSRSRIREALRALSLIGFVTIKPGGGTFVGNQIDEMRRRRLSGFSVRRSAITMKSTRPAV